MIAVTGRFATGGRHDLGAVPVVLHGHANTMKPTTVFEVIAHIYAIPVHSGR